jgi:thiol-disulfide isomerase/thioredoxin
MTEIKSIAEFETFIENHYFSFIFISREECGVCHALLPQVKELLQRFPEIQLGHIDAGIVEEIAGLLMVFTVPVLLLFVDGKEYIREARFVHMEMLEEKISRIYNGITG